jgi:cation diffusion facilitator CzcD-associated flavoprotein CzcO
MMTGNNIQDAAPDVVVVGAGIGGMYAIIRLRKLGFSVVGVEAAPEVGGVWYHNNYPGARVDLESDVFCYFFDDDLYQSWTWTERYASQPEVLSYLKHVADRFDVRRSILFETRVVGTTWLPDEDRWQVETDSGQTLKPRFVVMAAGQLSRPRDPDFPGLASFAGEWYQTSRWPHHDVDLTGKRVGVIGTGSSGVQTITAVAEVASHLTVFQRTPHYSAPAQNRKPDESRRRRLRNRFPVLWDELLDTPSGGFMPPPAGRAADFALEQRQQLMQQRWDFGSQSMLLVFQDQLTDVDSNAHATEFVQNKIRDKIMDPKLRDSLVPEYALGTKRLILDTGYYEVFNQDNVSLVDVRENPIQGITPSGIQTRDALIELDVIIFAMGFEAFTGALDDANITNDKGISPSQAWDRGPQTYLGLQTRGFPNMFFLTGPGSPSVLANMFVGNVHHVDLVGDLLMHMRDNNHHRVQPSQESQDQWATLQAAAAENLIRRQANNYMVKVNADDSRVYIPYGGGLDQYVTHCEAETASGYRGFDFA